MWSFSYSDSYNEAIERFFYLLKLYDFSEKYGIFLGNEYAEFYNEKIKERRLKHIYHSDNDKEIYKDDFNIPLVDFNKYNVDLISLELMREIKGGWNNKLWGKDREETSKNNGLYMVNFNILYKKNKGVIGIL